MKKQTHMVIPDCQIKPGVPTDHLKWAGMYAAKKRPDTIICLGDFADMPSLSEYDKGKKCYEGRSYANDIASVKSAMELFLTNLYGSSSKPGASTGRNKAADKGHDKGLREYAPRLIMLYGNHEDRINRAIQGDRKLTGTISLSDLGYREAGWEVVPYLAVKAVDGVHYSHYFTSGVLGKPVSSARALLTNRHVSAVMGHVQKRDIAYAFTGSGKQLTAIFAGVFYQHNEEYLGPQGNKCWRGIWMLHNVQNGEFDECPVPLSYLKEKYGKV